MKRARTINDYFSVPSVKKRNNSAETNVSTEDGASSNTTVQSEDNHSVSEDELGASSNTSLSANQPLVLENDSQTDHKSKVFQS